MAVLFGASSTKLVDKNKIKLLTLLAEDKPDGIGVYNSETIFRSYAMNPAEFMACPEFIKLKDSSYWLGYATKTTITKSLVSVSPYPKKDSIGFLNGFIVNTYALHKDEKLEGETNPTNVVYELISKYGLDKTLPMLESSELSLSYYDKKTGDSVLFSHNSPIYIGSIHEGKDVSIYWCTNDVHLKTIGCENVTPIPNATIVRIKNGKTVSAKAVLEEEKPKKLKQYTQLPTQTRSKARQYTQVQRHSIPKTAICEFDILLGAMVVWWMDYNGELVVYFSDDTSKFSYDLSKQVEKDFLMADAPGLFPLIVEYYNEQKQYIELVDELFVNSNIRRM